MSGVRVDRVWAASVAAHGGALALVLAFAGLATVPACKRPPTLEPDPPWSPFAVELPGASPPPRDETINLDALDSCPPLPAEPTYACAPVPKSKHACEGAHGLFYPIGCIEQSTQRAFMSCSPASCNCQVVLGVKGPPGWMCDD